MNRHDIQDATGVVERAFPQGITRAIGTTVPTDGTKGYAPGCVFVKLNGTVGTLLYVNEGTNTSCDFNTVGTLGYSSLLVAAGSTLTLTAAYHGRTILLDTAAGSVVTLPAASGSGVWFMFKVSVLATSNSHKIQVASASDIMQGVLTTIDTDTAGTVTGWATASDSDTITLNRSTTGSAMRGEWVELQDVGTNLWLVRGQLANTGSGATPFSAAV